MIVIKSLSAPRKLIEVFEKIPAEKMRLQGKNMKNTRSPKMTSKGLCELLIKIFGQFNIFRNLDFDCRYIGEFFERNRPDLFDQEPIFFPLGSSNIPTPTSARSARVFHGGFYSFTGILFFSHASTLVSWE